MTEVFVAFLRLGLTSFGGPVAHIGYFREAFVQRRRWLTEQQYAELVALCQFLPGPASSQVGMAIGLQRAGMPGMAAAWLAFTLPSAMLLVAFAIAVGEFGGALGTGWLTGMKAAAAAVVAHAVAGMAATLARGVARAGIAVAAAGLLILLPGALSQLLVISLGGVAGWLWLRDTTVASSTAADRVRVGTAWPWFWLGLFILLLGVLPLAAQGGEPILQLLDRFYRAGALVFGGGHVVLPLLHAEVVDTGMVNRDDFLAGYGAAQAIPGPLFSFSAYLGFVAEQGPSGLTGAALALMAIFLPSALLLAGVLPHWQRLRSFAGAQRALAGVNAAVVGLLAAALWNPVLREGVTDAPSALLTLLALGLLFYGRAPAWLVVMGAAVAGGVLL